ncbi:MAG: sulfite exporter TauE/SafE family protein [Planctomycetota bacterium]
MDLPDLLWWQWLLGGLAAMLVGLAKTGIPGAGILVVPLMASAFGGRPSVGTLLPLLIVADCFAVFWYRRHAQWDKLWGLVPWVAVGLGLGGLVHWLLGDATVGGWRSADLFTPLIGLVVLLMLGIHLLRTRLGDRLTPHSRLGVAAAGTGTGVATTLANAAGPIMTIYLAGKGLPKEQFMGTNAWFFLLLNLSKVPLFLLVAALPDAAPLITPASLTIDACLLPLIVPGVFLGKWLLPRFSNTWFYTAVLGLAALAALKLLLQPVLGW